MLQSEVGMSTSLKAQVTAAALTGHLYPSVNIIWLCAGCFKAHAAGVESTDTSGQPGYAYITGS
jgi:hypothetical protein